MDFFSFNYKPKDFKKGDRDKTLPEILEMKPGKVSLDFFTKYEKEIAEAGLRPETISAIHFLSDLKNKGDIFDKCYKPGQHMHMRRSSPHPMQAQQAPIQAPMQQAPMPETQMPEPLLGEDDKRPLIEGQSGGRRRHSRKHRSIKHRTRKHRKGDHTECTHSGGKRTKQSGGRRSRKSKHSGGRHRRSKHSGGKHRRSKHRRSRHKHRKTYKGGAVMGLNDVVNKSNPAPALTPYKPVVNTSEK